MKYAIAKPLTVAALLVASAAFANQPPAIVEAAVVTRENTAPTADLPGTVISTRDAQVRAEIEGRIDWIAWVLKSRLASLWPASTTKRCSYSCSVTMRASSD